MAKRLNPVRTPIREADPTLRSGAFVEVLHPYTLEEAIAEAQRCIQCGKPYCIEACPIGQDARGYIKRIADGDFDGARDLILKDNPLACSLGLVCYHYCEAPCPVGKRGEPVAIRQLKRAALDHASSADRYRVETPPTGKCVAIVGGGPAGLMAAWVLAQRGHEVTVIESADRLGGLMTQTIPAYRLTDEDFAKDFSRMGALGIRFRLETTFPQEVDLDGLRAEYDAVLLAIGTHVSRRLGVPGEDLDGVHHALHYLKESKRGERASVRPRVVVIGGGDVAIDGARSALRHGAESVTILYRRSREEMPASDEEVQEAEEEGVELRFLASPVRFLGETRLEGIEVQPMVLGPPDESGRRRPVPSGEPPLTIACDVALVAISQQADASIVPQELEVRTGKDGYLTGDAETGATAIPGVFVGGGASVVHAMASGKRAAEGIATFLSGVATEQPPAAQ